MSEQTLIEKIEKENPDLVYGFLVFEDGKIEVKTMNKKLTVSELAAVFCEVICNLPSDQAMFITTSMAMQISKLHGGITTADNHG